MKRRTIARIALQALGAIVGVALFVWTIRLAFTPENQESIERLLHAGPLLMLSMVALNLATVVINGLVFWITAKPVHPIPASSAVLTNAVCSFLAFLPFKASFIARMVIHHKRDGVSLRHMAPWAIGYGLGAIASFTPMLLAAAMAPRIGALWIPLGVGGAFACTLLGTLLAKFAAARSSWMRAASLGSYVIVKNTPVMMIACSLRVLDMGVQAARFLVAAAALGFVLPVGQAVFDATVYFLVGSVSPGGVLGFREGGLTWFASLLDLSEKAIEQVALLALAVTGAEAATFFVFAVIAAGALRLDRLLLRRTLEDTNEAPNAEELR